MKPKLAIVILNYKTASLTMECLKSFEDQIDEHILAIVVDNNSGDDSCETISECISRNKWESWCRLLRSEVNDGFSAGINLGIQEVDAEAYLLLNSDTLIHPGALKTLLRALQLNPDVGLIAPRLENLDGDIDQNTFRYTTPIYEFIRAANTRHISSILQRFEIALKPEDKPFEPQWVGFACVMVRKEVVDTVGLLDEGFFMYFEDIDYCRRINAEGWKILYWPHARVVHLLGKSSGVTEVSSRRRRPPKYFYESRTYYFKKYYGLLGYVSANIFWSAGRCISFLRETIGDKKPTHRENEFRDIWTGFRIKIPRNKIS